MKLAEYKQRLVQDAFNNRVSLNLNLQPTERQICDNCDERIVFALQDKNLTFSVGISTVLECLQYAEWEGCVPPLPESWWILAKTANGKANPSLN